ncbi:hypothetical protein O6H91_03G113800 [Diphasiastrum complanatum]|uniref:Uncharacterized protein n=3 Tax=Diphasiastrum complanatum TaxID=34168 RepID=A0ACC2EB54_DIPCM|nr:hypothetical protein O6H91_03G113800 [Diphasiastrum complanatum]KAJ7563522.1 hypothetical protein O6H91_03G113800 [Diphasiastrum complanatum]KAJ7563523.1 hypothetical protein O6H91_03G113800 [Diphasiastrum complanatum]
MCKSTCRLMEVGMTSGSLSLPTLTELVNTLHPLLKELPEWLSGPYELFKDDEIRICDRCKSPCDWIFFSKEDKNGLLLEHCGLCIHDDNNDMEYKFAVREGLEDYLSSLNSLVCASASSSMPSSENDQKVEEQDIPSLRLSNYYIQQKLEREKSNELHTERVHNLVNQDCNVGNEHSIPCVELMEHYNRRYPENQITCRKLFSLLKSLGFSHKTGCHERYPKRVGLVVGLTLKGYS